MKTTNSKDYLVGVFEPVEIFNGHVIAMTEFQERFFKSEILR